MQKINFIDFDGARISEIPTLDLNLLQVIEEHDYIIHTVLSIISLEKSGEEFFILTVEGVNKNEFFRLPKELNDWGNRLAKKNMQHPIEVRFSLIEETGLWEIGEVIGDVGVRYE
ncbi:TPA: hypothetical protein QCU60_004315 [Bacillus cereus]|nr:hypothetical protein [Bacillus cereus]HDR6312329.1 hypothetical protein [Bacillus cereus]